MHICYIIRSSRLRRYYIGYTSKSIQSRIKKHNNSFYGVRKYTHGANDWELFYSIECESMQQAIRIERHIKRMKSKVYIENLKKYSEISRKLLEKYK